LGHTRCGRTTGNVRQTQSRPLASQVKIAIQIEGNLTAEQRAELLREADSCYVHRMIKGEWNIEKAVHSLEKVVEKV
jgi:putative redox protein